MRQGELASQLAALKQSVAEVARMRDELKAERAALAEQRAEMTASQMRSGRGRSVDRERRRGERLRRSGTAREGQLASARRVGAAASPTRNAPAGGVPAAAGAAGGARSPADRVVAQLGEAEVDRILGEPSAPEDSPALRPALPRGVPPVLRQATADTSSDGKRPLQLPPAGFAAAAAKAAPPRSALPLATIPGSPAMPPAGGGRPPMMRQASETSASERGDDSPRTDDTDPDDDEEHVEGAPVPAAAAAAVAVTAGRPVDRTRPACCCCCCCCCCGRWTGICRLAAAGRSGNASSGSEASARGGQRSGRQCAWWRRLCSARGNAADD